jgi:hypothetical protein
MIKKVEWTERSVLLKLLRGYRHQAEMQNFD